MGSLWVFVFFSSVLKEMVRDLEQIKENGESQLIAKKDKCSSHANANGQHCKRSVLDVVTTHVLPFSSALNNNNIYFRPFLPGCSDHSDMMDNHANHTKICHRGDGQCTCYYCTIFGHAVSSLWPEKEQKNVEREILTRIFSDLGVQSWPYE